MFIITDRTGKRFLKHIAGDRFEWVTERSQATRYSDEATAGFIAQNNNGVLIQA